jgi:hypothetical protein
VPKHQPPEAASEGFKVSPFSPEEDRRFFDDFQDFAIVMDWWWAGRPGRSPWRLQELPETSLKLGYWDMPMYGRRYSIFHNQVSVGTLEIRRGLHYSADTPDVFTDIELRWVRLLAFGTVRMFLHDIAEHVCDKRYIDARTPDGPLPVAAAIDRSMAEVLWDTQQISDIDLGQDYGTLELQLGGSAYMYFYRRQALRNKGAAE